MSSWITYFNRHKLYILTPLLISLAESLFEPQSFIPIYSLG